MYTNKCAALNCTTESPHKRTLDSKQLRAGLYVESGEREHTSPKWEHKEGLVGNVVMCPNDATAGAPGSPLPERNDCQRWWLNGGEFLNLGQAEEHMTANPGYQGDSERERETEWETQRERGQGGTEWETQIEGLPLTITSTWLNYLKENVFLMKTRKWKMTFGVKKKSP